MSRALKYYPVIQMARFYAFVIIIAGLQHLGKSQIFILIGVQIIYSFYWMRMLVKYTFIKRKLARIHFYVLEVALNVFLGSLLLNINLLEMGYSGLLDYAL